MDPASGAAGPAGERHRFAILADQGSWAGPRTSLAERAAAARRELLGQLDAVTAILTTPAGLADEGIDPIELARLRTAGLRLAAAADAALSEVRP